MCLCTEFLVQKFYKIFIHNFFWNDKKIGRNILVQNIFRYQFMYQKDDKMNIFLLLQKCFENYKTVFGAGG